MKGTITAKMVTNGRGAFFRGDHVDWPRNTLKPLIDADMAVEGHVELQPELEVEVTDAARELADENDLSLTEVEGSGKNGRIVKGDVQEALVDRAAEEG